MYNKPKLTIKHQIEDLICFIEKNDFESFKLLVQECPKIIKKTKMDDNEPIVYAIRYGHFKIFKFLIETLIENNLEIEVNYPIITYHKIFIIFKRSTSLSNFFRQIRSLAYFYVKTKKIKKSSATS